MWVRRGWGYAMVIDNPHINGLFLIPARCPWKVHIHHRLGGWMLGVWAILIRMTWTFKLTEQLPSRKLSVTVTEGKRALGGFKPTTMHSYPDITHVTSNPLARANHICCLTQMKGIQQEVRFYQVPGTGKKWKHLANNTTDYSMMELKLREIEYLHKITWAISDRVRIWIQRRYVFRDDVLSVLFSTLHAILLNEIHIYL